MPLGEGFPSNQGLQ